MLQLLPLQFVNMTNFQLQECEPFVIYVNLSVAQRSDSVHVYSRSAGAQT